MNLSLSASLSVLPLLLALIYFGLWHIDDLFR